MDLGDKKFIYGFPIINENENCIKIATDQHEIITMSDNENKEPDGNKSDEIYKNYIQPHIIGITNKCIKTAFCLYTLAPQERFVIDYLPGYNNQVIVVSPCSGHGFKHSAAIGEALAQLILKGKSDIDIINIFGNTLEALE